MKILKKISPHFIRGFVLIFIIFILTQLTRITAPDTFFEKYMELFFYFSCFSFVLSGLIAFLYKR